MVSRFEWAMLKEIEHHSIQSVVIKNNIRNFVETYFTETLTELTDVMTSVDQHEIEVDSIGQKNTQNFPNYQYEQ